MNRSSVFLVAERIKEFRQTNESICVLNLSQIPPLRHLALAFGEPCVAASDPQRGAHRKVEEKSHLGLEHEQA